MEREEEEVGGGILHGTKAPVLHSRLDVDGENLNSVAAAKSDSKQSSGKQFCQFVFSPIHFGDISYKKFSLS